MNSPATQTESGVATREDAPRFRRPVYDVQTAEDHYTIRAIMPGVDREHLEVSLDGNNLTIEGKRRNPAGENWKPLLEELSHDDYRLQLQLNVQIGEDITAKVEDGVLTLTLPKSEASKPRLIPIQ